MKAKEFFFMLLLLLAVFAIVIGTVCLGIAILQLVFGMGSNIVIVCWGFSLLASGIIVVVLVEAIWKN